MTRTEAGGRGSPAPTRPGGEDEIVAWTKRTVVGVDASPTGTAALEWAVRHAEGGTVPAVSVCRMCPEVCGGDDALHAAQRRVLREAVTRLGTAWDARIQEAVVDGEPGPALVGLAEDADVLVLGGHHYHRAGAAAIGSVVSYCVQHLRLTRMTRRKSLLDDGLRLCGPHSGWSRLGGGGATND
jgi:nucleotide-binding universal stress UspA family protein